MSLIPTVIILAGLLPMAPAAFAGEVPVSLAEHFPLEENLGWRYNSNLGEVKSTVIVENERLTIDSRSRRLDIVQNYILAPEGVFLTSAESRAFLYFSRRTYHPYFLRFPAEIPIGRTWEWKGKEVMDRKKIVESRAQGVIEGREKVTVPAGEFDCLRVTVETVSDDGTVSSSTQWLAPRVGIVKAEVEIEAGGISGLLISLLGFDTYFLELLEMTGPDGETIFPEQQ